MLLRILKCTTLVGAALASLAMQAATVAPVAEVASISSSRVADLVVLGSGFDAGLRQGMVCRLTRGTVEIAEVLLVELRPACSSALILSLAPGQTIRSGDRASLKVLKSQLSQ